MEHEEKERLIKEAEIEWSQDLARKEAERMQAELQNLGVNMNALNDIAVLKQRHIAAIKRADLLEIELNRHNVMCLWYAPTDEYGWWNISCQFDGMDAAYRPWELGWEYCPKCGHKIAFVGYVGEVPTSANAVLADEE